MFPGRLWRIYGSEYASEPYLPPKMFREYVTTYDKPMVEMIRKHEGFARIHSHGNLRNIIEYIMEMQPDALDPIEPSPQGDVELAEIQEKYGKAIVLMGNVETNWIEGLEPDLFREKINQTLKQGATRNGRGFVLMPTASPCGRTVSDRMLNNYKLMVEAAASWSY